MRLPRLERVTLRSPLTSLVYSTKLSTYESVLRTV